MRKWDAWWGLRCVILEMEHTRGLGQGVVEGWRLQLVDKYLFSFDFLLSHHVCPTSYPWNRAITW
jgi:hypothetical protein